MILRVTKMWLLTKGLTVLAVVSLSSGLCHDIDIKACELMLRQNPGLCSDPALSSTACPKFCGKCSSLTCYHCDSAVKNFLDCNTTRTCQPGEQCILHQLMSSRDGHQEFRMSCASLDICDGSGTLFGRRDLESRDIRSHCCKDDLCNYPTATTPPPTPASCSRDIEILIQDSSDRSSPAYIISFVKDLISRLDIGPTNNQIAVATVNDGVHRQFHLDEHNNKVELLAAVDQVNFRHLTNDIDVPNLIHYLSNEMQLGKTHNGDRSAYKNSVIIIAEQATNINSHHHLHSSDQRADISSLIVMKIGSVALPELSALATVPQHLIDVKDYTVLSQHLSEVVNLLCM